MVLLLSLVSAVLAVEVVVLARENRRLQAGQAPPAVVENAHFVMPGDLLGDSYVRDVRGQPVAVRFDGSARGTLVLVFAADCGACKLVRPEWEQLLGQLPSDLRTLLLQLDHQPATSPPESLGLPVHSLEGTGTTGLGGLSLKKFTTVPITLLLDEAGVVLWSHYGVLGEARTASLKEALERLP